MQDIDHLDLVDKLSRILAALHDDINKNKQAHQNEILELQKIIKDQQLQIDRLNNVVQNHGNSRNKKQSIDEGNKSKPLFARKKSALVAQLTVDIPHPPKNIYPATTKNKTLNSSTSLSSILNSRQKIISKNASQDKYDLHSSREKKSRSKNKAELCDRKYYGISKKIEVKNKENKQPSTSSSKYLSNSSASRGKLVKLFQRAQENVTKKTWNEDRSQLMWPKGSQNPLMWSKGSQNPLMWSKGSQNPLTSSQQQKKFINIYLPNKLPGQKRQWR